MKEYPKWIDNFVSYDKETDEYVAWDETQANEIGRGESRDEMVNVVIKYANWLEDERSKEKNV